MSSARKLYTQIRDALDPETRKAIRKAMALVLPSATISKPDDMRGRIFDLTKKQMVELDGFRFYVMPNDYIGYSIIHSKTYEPHVTKLVRSILRQGDVFMDVGANVGYFTFLAASLVGKEGKVIALEPNPQNLHLIYSTILSFPEINVDIYPYAASDAAGILKFVTVGSNGGVVRDDYDILVPSMVVDKMLKDEPRIDLIKIDIEAHEPAAIRGMEALLRKHRPKLITEYHPWALKNNNKEPPVAYLEQLYALGYRLSIIETSGNILDVSNAAEILAYWEALNSERINMDLYAQPQSVAM